jgi:FMN reductase (NADPH)
MTIGWPQKAALIRPRLPIAAVLHWDTYQMEDQRYLKEYDLAMIDTGIYKGRQVDGINMDSEDYGWMEHSARRTSKPSRPHLRKSILNTGFTMK